MPWLVVPFENNQPILTQRESEECLLKSTMTYTQAIDYLFYKNKNAKNSLFRGFLLAFGIGYIVSLLLEQGNEYIKSTILPLVKANDEKEDYVSLQKTILFSTVDLVVSNIEPYTQVTFPYTFITPAHNIQNLPMSSKREEINRKRVRAGQEPLKNLQFDELVQQNLTLLGVGIRAMGGYPSIPLTRAYTIGIYADSTIQPELLRQAKKKNKDTDVVNVETVLLSHNIQDKSIRMVFCQDINGKHIADGFYKSFGRYINNIKPQDNNKNTDDNGIVALEKLRSVQALIPKFNCGDEIIFTWSKTGHLVLTLPDHAFDHLSFYNEGYGETGLTQRKRLRDMQEWRDIIKKIQQDKPKYPAPTLQLSEPLRPAAVFDSPTLCQSIFQAFISKDGISVGMNDTLHSNWDSLLNQISSE